MIKLNGEYYITQEEFIKFICRYGTDTTFADFTKVKPLNDELAKLNPLLEVADGDDHFRLKDLVHVLNDSIEHYYHPNDVTTFKVLSICVSSDICHNIDCFVSTSILSHTLFTIPVELRKPIKFDTSNMFVLVTDVLDYLLDKTKDYVTKVDFDLSELNRIANVFTRNIFKYPCHEPMVPELINTKNIQKNNVLLNRITVLRDTMELELDKLVQTELMPWSASIDNKEDK